MKETVHLVERWTGHALKFGVWVSGTLMVCGLIVAALHGGSFTMPHENPAIGTLLRRFADGALDATTLLYLGLVALMLTPFVRVFTAIMGFLAERDWKFVLVSVTVFAMLVGELVYSLTK